MLDLEEIKKRLEATIGESRVNHSIRVMSEAIRLAKTYNVDEESAMTAGLLHDCARFTDKSCLLKNMDEFDIILEKPYMKNTNLFHAYLGKEVAREEYGITDKGVLNAIKYHTTGREDMSMLEKVVYMADYIEPARSFKGVDEIRTLAYKDIDKALICALDNTIRFLIEKKEIIHEDTIKARNYLLFETIKN